MQLYSEQFRYNRRELMEMIFNYKIMRVLHKNLVSPESLPQRPTRLLGLVRTKIVKALLAK